MQDNKQKESAEMKEILERVENSKLVKSDTGMLGITNKGFLKRTTL